MRLFMPFARTVQARNCTRNDINDLRPAGSPWLAAVACIAAILLIGVTAATNISHAWETGLARSTFHAAVLAGGSLGSALAAPVALAAAFEAARRWRLASSAVALALGILALVYNSVSTTGFISTARTDAAAIQIQAADAYADRRDLVSAAKRELAQLRGQAPRIVARRAELMRILADAKPADRTQVRPAQRDAQAASLATYLKAAGIEVEVSTLGMWLALGQTLFFEIGAALSLITARSFSVGKLYRATRQNAVEGGSVREASTPAATPSEPQTVRQRRAERVSAAPARKAKVSGRKQVEAAIVAKVKANGSAPASVRKLGKMVKGSRTTTHTALTALLAAGVVAKVGAVLIIA